MTMTTTTETAHTICNYCGAEGSPETDSRGVAWCDTCCQWTFRDTIRTPTCECGDTRQRTMLDENGSMYFSCRGCGTDLERVG